MTLAAEVITGGAIVVVFVLAVVGAGAKWWAPWMGKKVGHAAAAGFKTEITTTSISAATGVVQAYEARAVERERDQDEKISHVIDEVQIVHELAIHAGEQADIIAARLDDLVIAVDTLNTSGFSTLAELLTRSTAFQGSLLEMLPTLGVARRADIAGIIPIVVTAPIEEDPHGQDPPQPE